MDRVHYSGDSFLTGTAIAHALLDYAQALAESGASATVEIPTINSDGTRVRSEILIGPASQLRSSAEDAEFDEITDEQLVARMHEEASTIRVHGVHPVAARIIGIEPDASWSDFDYPSTRRG